MINHNNYEEIEEYKMMYKYVMRNSKERLKTTSEIIEYLVNQCYYIELYNEQLIDTIEKIKITLGVIEDSDFEDLLPF